LSQNPRFPTTDAVVDFDEVEQNDVFQVLVDKLTTFFSPKQNSSFERHMLRSLIPSSDESFAKFVLRLRQQIKRCDFGSTKADIEEICLKDKVIDAWASGDLKRKLLEKEHSLDEILEACQVDEKIRKESALMTKNTEEPVNRVTTSKPKGNMRNFECGRCGRSGH